ncbi:MAG: hypothetical protein ACKO8Q_06345 [Bacteroidota bacterium]
MSHAILEKYGVKSNEDLQESIEELLFVEMKKWKERLQIRPLRRKHLNQMQLLSEDHIAVFGSAQCDASSLIWEKQGNWLMQLRHFETSMAKGLTQVFRAVSPNEIVFHALHLSNYIEEFENELLNQESNFLAYSSEVNSRDSIDTARCIQFFIENKQDEAMELIRKEIKRLRTILN